MAQCRGTLAKKGRGIPWCEMPSERRQSPVRGVRATRAARRNSPEGISSLPQRRRLLSLFRGRGFRPDSNGWEGSPAVSGKAKIMCKYLSESIMGFQMKFGLTGYRYDIISISVLTHIVYELR